MRLVLLSHVTSKRTERTTNRSQQLQHQIQQHSAKRDARSPQRRDQGCVDSAWGPVVGSGVAAIGIYVMVLFLVTLARDVRREKKPYASHLRKW